jgi:hypothetical protein
MLYEDRSSIARNVWLLGSVPFWAQSGHRPGGCRATYSTGNPFKFDDCRRKLGGTRWWPQNKRWPVDEAYFHWVSWVSGARG